MKQIIRVEYEGPPCTQMQAADLLRRLIEFGWDAYESGEVDGESVDRQLEVIDPTRAMDGPVPTFAVFQGEGVPSLSDLRLVLDNAFNPHIEDEPVVDAVDRLKKALGL